MAGRISWIVAVAIGLTLALPAVADDNELPKVKTAKLKLPDGVPDTMAKLLAPEAWTVTYPGSAESLTFWFRAGVPAVATADQIKNGIGYQEIPEGTLIGVVRVSNGFIDYRKQSVAEGVYTLRFAMQPDVGDHLGTSPHPEFLLLSPIENDQTAETVEPKKAVRNSSEITGGDHPSMMLLLPFTGKPAEPRISDRGEGVAALTFRRPVTVGSQRTEIGFSVVILGSSSAR